jgi:hypothetical protein
LMVMLEVDQGGHLPVGILVEHGFAPRFRGHVT